MPLQGEYAPSTSDWARTQAEAYEASGGTEAATLRDSGLPVIVLTTLGAKSGKLRKTALMRVEHDGVYAVVASLGGAPKHPQWYFNIVAEPLVDARQTDRRGDRGVVEADDREVRVARLADRHHRAEGERVGRADEALEAGAVTEQPLDRDPGRRDALLGHGHEVVALGGAEGAFEAALKYADERKTFGKPIKKHQAIAFKLADMATQIEAGRHLLYKGCWLKDQGKPFGKEAAMAKLFCSEMMGMVVDQAVQIHGGYGLMEEYPVARFYRDHKLLEIGEGSSEVQRIVISRHLGC